MVILDPAAPSTWPAERASEAIAAMTCREAHVAGLVTAPIDVEAPLNSGCDDEFLDWLDAAAGDPEQADDPLVLVFYRRLPPPGRGQVKQYARNLRLWLTERTGDDARQSRADINVITKMPYLDAVEMLNSSGLEGIEPILAGWIVSNLLDELNRYGTTTRFREWLDEAAGRASSPADTLPVELYRHATEDSRRRVMQFALNLISE